MNILIVEDEQLGYERLVRLLQDIDPELVILGHTVSIHTTVAWLGKHPAPDLIFMDIELSDGQCFEIFNQLEVTSPIIFTTSYDEYALRAFKVNSVDYLLKPIRKEELQRSLQKWRGFKQADGLTGLHSQIETLLQEFRLRPEVKYRHRFLVKQGQRLLSVEINEVAWFHADGKLCFIKTWENQRYLIDYSLEELEGMLDPQKFYRINRAYIAHHKSIKNINAYFKGKLILQLSPATDSNDVIVSKEKSSAFKKWLGK